MVVLLGAGCAQVPVTSTTDVDNTAVTPQPQAEQSPAQPEEEVQLTLDARLTIYEAERETCITQRLKEVEGGLQAGSRNKAEHYCTIIVMSRKYYPTDPEGMIELCIREAEISGYTKEKGLPANATQEQRTFWETLCRGIIEINQKKL